MFPLFRRPILPALPLLLLALLLLLLPPPAPARARQDAAGKDESPIFKEYKGVTIGMPMDEARKKLGEAMDKSDKQDFYVYADGDETAQVYYDGEKKVSAVAVVYSGGRSAPVCRAVLGKEAEAKPDGSQYLRLNYPKAGYWVSYSRTAGDTPVTSITMKKP